MCANSDQNFTVCLIVPNEKQLRLLIKKNGNGEVVEDFRQLCTDPQVVQAVTKAITAHAVQCKSHALLGVGVGGCATVFSICVSHWLHARKVA